MVKQAGKALGFGHYADAIQQTPSGRYVVNDPAVRGSRSCSCARTRPPMPSMAGVFTQQNAAMLANRIGRKPSEGELYMAHFFGPGGASKLIQHGGQHSDRQCGADVSGARRAPTVRSSTTGRAMPAASPASMAS